MSSGAAMLAAMRTAERIDRGNIVVVFPDRAEKYLSARVFQDFKVKNHVKLLKHIL